MPDISYYLIKGSLKRSLHKKSRRIINDLLIDIPQTGKKSTYEQRFFSGFRIILACITCIVMLTFFGLFKSQGSNIPEGTVALINQAIEESMIMKDIDSMFFEKEEE